MKFKKTKKMEKNKSIDRNNLINFLSTLEQENKFNYLSFCSGKKCLKSLYSYKIELKGGK